MLRVASLHILVSIFFFVSVPCASYAATQSKRVALVIGNSSYEYTAPLANPVNDAEDMATALTALGFEVTKSLDLDKAKMATTLAEFAAALNGAEIGLFYYAGHGLQVSGKNYLVPIDASLKSASALDFEAVSLDVVQRLMENETQTNVLFLDACRDNPLTRNLARSMGTRSSAIGKGLAPQESGAGTLISYSTQPGNVALDGTGERNSPFAAALIKHLPAEGQALPTLLVRVRNDVMEATAKRQVPWEYSALTDELILKAKAEHQAPETVVTPEVKASVASDQDNTESQPTNETILLLDHKLTFAMNEEMRFYAEISGSYVVINYATSNEADMTSKPGLNVGEFFDFKTDTAAYRAMLTDIQLSKSVTLKIRPIQ
ncbi:MAG TPA: caspase domain-containing protein [Hyphomicrobiales bacterium]|nr:caspase domain-containing protein [Hyphomicrobiales bacterium]